MLYSWGSTENGELGFGGQEVEQVFVPKLNNFGSSQRIKQIAAGLMHTLFLVEEGQVFSCGSNDVGQLGHMKITRRPEHVDALEGYKIVQVAAGDQHSLSLTSWGVVYAWGENGFGQLGVNSLESHLEVPRIVKSLATKQVNQISCGAHHTLAMTVAGDVYAWGLNSSGQLGLGHRNSPIYEPQIIKLMAGVPLRVLTAGGQNSAAVTQTGFLLTWGSNKYGQLGKSTGSVQCCTSPTIVNHLASYSEPLRYVALGESHMAVLDAFGKIWTFGYGRYGQLGHGNNEDSSIPKPVLDLVGSKVSQVACGRCHTIVYISSQGQVYAFGQGMSGQLGMKTPQNRSLPQVVPGPWLASNVKRITDTPDKIFYVKNVFAGGDSSFATVCKEPFLGYDYCISYPFPLPLTIEESKINQMLNIDDEEIIEDDLFTYCETVMGALCCWNGSFLKIGKSKVDHNLDYRLAEECINKLGRITRDVIVEVVNSGIERLVKDLPTSLLTPEAMRVYILLPLWKGFSDVKNAAVLQRPFAKAFLTVLLTPPALTHFRSWLQTLPIDCIQSFVSCYKKVVAYIIHSQKNNMKPLSGTLQEEKSLLMDCLKLLELLYNENKSLPIKKARLPYEEFYISEISDSVDIRSDYLNWLSRRPNSNNEMDQVCFCRYSFLFDSKAKSILLREDAMRQMHGAVQDAMFQHLANPFIFLTNPEVVQFLTLHVNRTNLVADTIAQINTHHYNDLKRPLKVTFIGEEAEDAGGVKREFFLLLLKDLLNPDYGMFDQYNETNTIWFREGALEVDDMYYLIGIVCGLAIYNTTIINLPFPLALYKKLLDESVGLDDFSELDPSLTRNLRSLLEYEGSDVEDVFCLNFTITKDYFGETKTIPLKPRGEEIAVTSENRQEYVDLLIDWRLNKAIDKQYKLFHQAFHRVCGGGILKLFQPMELMGLVTGNENYDWTEFETNTTYQGEFYRDHPTIKIFWEVFHELSHEQKKKFLLFLTGCDRVPILGMRTIRMVIYPVRDDNFLPVAHTCIIQLDLPTYHTKEKLKYKLLQAIQQSEGFGLV